MSKPFRANPVFKRTLTYVSLVLFVVFGLISLLSLNQKAQATTNSNINFQARVLQASGAVVADGSYNVQFNLYYASGGGSIWTETYLNSSAQGIVSKNGYITTSLGSITPFGGTIQWDQGLTLGLTIRGTGSCAWGACTPTDSEMTPRMTVTAMPLAFSAQRLQTSSGSFTSKLSITAPTVGDQLFVIPDQAAAGTFNVCLEGSSTCGFAPSSGSGNYANITLNNLNAVAINTSLISDANNTDDLGSDTLGWKDIYSRTLRLDGSTSGTITLQATATAGTNTLTLPATAGTLLVSPMTTEGDIIYRDGSGINRLARGNNGECLTSNTTTILWNTCSAGANTALSNLSAVAINTSLLPGADNTIDLGDSTTKGFRSLYADTSVFSPTVYGSLSTANATLTLQGNNAAAGNTSTNANLVFKVGNSGATTAVTILNSGNVGIGATSPGAKLEVSTSDSSTTLWNRTEDVTIRNTDGTNNTWTGLGFHAGGSIAAGIAAQYYDTGNAYATLNFGTRGAAGWNSTVMVLKDGNVGVGTASPSNRLHVEGTGGGSAGMYLNSAVPSNTSYTLYNNAATLYWNGAIVATGGTSISGTTNYIPIFTSSTAIGNSAIYQSGTVVRPSADNTYDLGSGSYTWKDIYGQTVRSPLVYGSSSANGTLTLQGTSASGNTGTNANLLFKVGDSGATTAMTILNNGNVGIGEGSPEQLLDVASSAAALTQITVSNTNASDYDAQIGFELVDNANIFTIGVDDSNTDSFSISTTALGTSERLTVSSTGNVGIGDNTPDQKLEVMSSGTALTQLTVSNTNAGDYDSQIGFELADGTNTFTLGVDDSDADQFKISTTGLGTNDRLTITSAGYVGIGVSAPANFLLQVAGSVGPNADNSYDLGSDTYGWKDIYTRTVKLDGATSGTITLQATAVAGTNTVSLPAASGTLALASTYLGGYGIADAVQLFAVANNANTELITNIVNRDFSGAGNWAGTNWALDTATWYHSVAGANSTTLANANLTGSSIITGHTYRLTFTVTGMAGSTPALTPYIGTASGVAVTADGTYTQYIMATANDADLIFTPNATMTGRIDNISLVDGGTQTGNMNISGTGIFGTSIYAPTAYGSSSANGTLTLQGTSASGNTGTNANLLFKVGDSGATTAMTILNNGNVGIGEGSPEQLLDVASSAAALTQITVSNTNASDYDAQIGFELVDNANIFTIGVDDSNTDSFSISTTALGTSERLTVSSTGNVGIGDNTPDQKLEVMSSGTALTQLTVSNTNAGDYDSQIGFELADGTNTFTLGVDDSDADQFKISTTGLGTNDRLTITSAGYVGIGVSAPANFLLQVAGSVGPNADNSYDLGSDTYGWKDIYTRTVKLDGATSGTITLQATAVAGTNTVSLPAASGTLALASTYLGGYGIADAVQLFAVANNANTELITNIVNRDFSGAGNWAGTNWALDTATWYHSVAGANNATLPNANLTGSSIVSGHTYRLTFTITSMSGSTPTLTPYIGTASGVAVTADGTYTQYIMATANDADLIFTPNATMTGRIDNISLVDGGTQTGNMNISGTGIFGTSIYAPTAYGSSSANGTLTLQGTSASGNTGTNANLLFKVGDSGATTAMTILNNGNVGIGEGSPEQLLDVASSAAALTQITVSNTNASDYDAQIGFELVDNANIFTIGVDDSNTDSFSISTTALGTSERLTVSSTGNVGIGDNTPDQKLEVMSSGTALTQLTVSNTNAGDYDSQIGFELADGTNTFTLGVDDSDADQFKISTTGLGTNDRLTITSAGYVGIGVSAPANFLLQVAGSVGPNADNSYDLGSDTYGWKDIYTRTVKLDGATSGTITLQATAVAGTNTVSLPAASGTLALASTYLGGYGIADAVQLFAVANNANTELITNIVNRDFSGAGNWAGTNWALDTATWYHSVAGANSTTLANANLTGSSIITGHTYRLTFTVTGMAGSTPALTPYIGTASGVAVTADGTYTQYIMATANDADLIFTPNATMTGRIDNISLVDGGTQTGNMNISGTGIFGTSIYAPTAYGSSSANGTLTLQGTSASGNTGTNANLLFKVGDSGATTAMTILNNGNVGIGEGSPEQLLDVASSAAALTQITVSNTNASDYDAQIGFELVDNANIFTIGVDDSNTDSFSISTTALGTSERLTVSSTGNVGIGDNTPDQKLEVMSSGTALTQLTVSNTNAGDYDSQIGFELADGTNTFTLGVDDSDADQFKISTTGLGTNDRLTITSAGYVGIGVSAPANFLLQVAGSVGPNADNSYDLGSDTYGWKDIYTRTVKLDGATSGTITLQATATAGTNTITLPAATGTVALTATTLAGYGITDGVQLQASTPGSAQTGNSNISGTGIFGTNILTPIIYGSSSANGTLTLEGTSASGNTSTNANLLFKVGDSGATTAMTILNNSNVGINVSAPSYRLDVADSQATSYVARIRNTSTANTADGLMIQLDVANGSRTTGNYFIAFAGGTGNPGTVAGMIQGGASVVAYTTSGADYAEYFKTDENNLPQPGELVELDASSTQAVKRSSGNAQQVLAGVVSSHPGFIGNGPICNIDDNNCDANYAKYNALISLSGQVDTKVNTSNGPIAVGDPITVSSTLGIGAKATTASYIVGYAQEPLASGQGTIKVLIRPQYYTPGYLDVIQGTALNLTGNAAIVGNAVISGRLDVNTIKVANLEVTGTATIQTLAVLDRATVNTLSVIGSADFASDINLTASVNTKQAVTKKFLASQPIPAGSVVVLDSTKDGYVTTTNIESDTKIVGVAVDAAIQEGDEIRVAVSGSVQVAVDGYTAVASGDMIVSDVNPGKAKPVNEPQIGAMLGKATSAKDANNLIWILITLR